jgi:hypothetical protein
VVKQGQTELQFDDRFLDRHAGAIISDTATAIVELVANAWDAYATEVRITWPNPSAKTLFSISDNGKGMTAEMFERRWLKLDYNRLTEESGTVEPPTELESFPTRKAYGKNGRGRHAAFRFSDPYTVCTRREGHEVTYEVRRGTTKPFEIRLIDSHSDVSGHGTKVSATSVTQLAKTAEDAREIIGTRFLADPNFRVWVNDVLVTFEDVPDHRVKEVEVAVEPFGIAKVIFVDAVKADKTTRQHGVAWRVNQRLVGSVGWTGFDSERIIDGRKSEAKRFQVIISADFLADHNAVLPDWSGFEPGNAAWLSAKEAVHASINDFLSSFSASKRRETKDTVKDAFAEKMEKVAPAGRERWNQFVDEVVDNCPSITADEVKQVAGVLANLELSTSKYGLITKLSEFPPGDLDALHKILEDWTIRLAKDALDEIQSRLKLIENLDAKLRDERADEVGDLQPLFEKSLWVFGPEFESIEFTSNKGMTTVIRNLLGKNIKGSMNRPDFVILPDGSVGFYSRDDYDGDHEVGGVARLVIAEIKRPGVVISSDQKDQAWKYVKELYTKGLIGKATDVNCYVLGSSVDAAEADPRTERDGKVVIRPLAYETFIKRAQARMLSLHKKLKDAPFLKELGVDAVTYATPQKPLQASLELQKAPAAGRA